MADNTKGHGEDIETLDDIISQLEKLELLSFTRWKRSGTYDTDQDDLIIFTIVMMIKDAVREGRESLRELLTAMIASRRQRKGGGGVEEMSESRDIASEVAVSAVPTSADMPADGSTVPVDVITKFTRNDVYPKFFRTNKGLSKVTWSDTRSEARSVWTPPKAIEKAIRVLETGGTRTIPIDSLKKETMEVVTEGQLYVVLKWLIREGLVQREGNEGYRVTVDNLRKAYLSRFRKLPTLEKRDTESTMAPKTIQARPVGRTLHPDFAKNPEIPVS